MQCAQILFVPRLDGRRGHGPVFQLQTLHQDACRFHRSALAGFADEQGPALDVCTALFVPPARDALQLRIPGADDLRIGDEVAGEPEVDGQRPSDGVLIFLAGVFDDLGQETPKEGERAPPLRDALGQLFGAVPKTTQDGLGHVVACRRESSDFERHCRHRCDLLLGERGGWPRAGHVKLGRHGGNVGRGSHARQARSRKLMGYGAGATRSHGWHAPKA